MTYRGANAQIEQKVLIVTGTNALAKASLMAKISQILSILSFIISTSMLGGSVYAYKYFSSEQFKTRVMNEVMERVTEILPTQIDKKLPTSTGKSLPL